MKKLITIIITTLVISAVLFNPQSYAHIVKVEKDLLDLDIPLENTLFAAVPRVLVNRIETLSARSVHENQFFVTPDAFSPLNFEVGEQVNIVVNSDFLAYSQEEYEKLNVVWDFGDGKKILAGPTVSHRYEETGSYIVQIGLIHQIDNAAGVNSSEQFAKQVSYANLQINVIPKKSYLLPEATLLGINNPTIFSKDRTQYIFDLSHSVTVSPGQYLFDYGDGKMTNKPISVHSYSRSAQHKRATARVWDANGFFDDEYIDVYPALEKRPTLLARYRAYMFGSLEDNLNTVFDDFRVEKIGKLELLSSTFFLGFLQFLLTPFVSILLVIYGSKRYGLRLKSVFHFSYSFVIVQVFFTLVLAFLTLYYTDGYVLTDAITKVQYILGGSLMLLLFSRVLLIKKHSKIETSEMATLSAALGIFVNPFAFAVLVMNTYILDIYDAMYLLLVFAFGMLVSYLFLIKLGLAIRKILFNRA